ncbi:hypothetical protein [Patulibacter sp.]|uniref:hypothetical protein n=1 Tax=Patulibacter sp. TaxID=1912859 RepID=UPI0027242276|nr:hypothetical protein [Patulibacter sp.]MDO9409507.1 hypothetical protein [Patulibacter sp.]
MNTPTTRSPSAPRKVGGALILTLMLAGGLFMWAGNPYLWIRVTAARADSQNLTMGQAAFVIFAIALTGFVMVKVLAVLNGWYAKVMGGSDEVTVRMPWNQSMRDGRTTGRTTSAIDVVMVGSVSIAIVVATIWFFFFATYG